MSTEELPDYLPVMLEFAALAPDRAGRELLGEHRVAIELIRRSLRDEGSPWAPLLEVVARSVPGLSRSQLARLRRLAAEGPPTEEVGLEPYAPPEVMPQPGGPPAEPLVGGLGR
jgi:nitrate reductase delta subunit